MFMSVAGAVKMFGGKLTKIIEEAGGKLVFSVSKIETWAVGEKIPFKLEVNDKKEIVITKR